MMNKQTWLRKISAVITLFIMILLFNINSNTVYESEMTVLFLPKNELTSQSVGLIAGNFKQILSSLAFCDRLAEQNKSFSAVQDLPNYKRKESCNAKLEVSQLEESAMLNIRSFDSDSNLARELNSDAVDNLIAVMGKYYNIKTDLDLRIIDGPIVKKNIEKNLILELVQSISWTIFISFVFFFLIPFVFVKKKTLPRQFSSSDLSQKSISKKVILPMSDEENYFATKDFFASNLPTAGKKASTPVNLPISEDVVPDIFRMKNVNIAPEVESEKEVNADVAYIPREATAEEVKERLNKLLRGEK